MNRSWLLLPLLLLPVGCSGAAGDPYAREYTWHATGDNEANLRAMVSDPRDLVEGRGTDTSLGSEAAPPVNRLLTGTRTPLPLLSASGIATSQTPQQTQPTPQNGVGTGVTTQ